jgi:exodeoxyribonuclease V alpha subunit
LTVAQAIDGGIAPGFARTRASKGVVVERSSVSGIEFHGVEFVATMEGSPVLDEFLDRWQQEIWLPAHLRELSDHEYAVVEGNFGKDDQERLRQMFAHWGRFRILCVTRVLPTGADRVNAVLHQRALQSLDGGRDNDLVPGEPVMMQVNDYSRMLFNGDQGLILNVSVRGQLQPMAVFPRSERFEAFHLESLRPVLLHSYAMTVHKAQGSEFDRVALILPDRDLPINTREILYTSLTRARYSVVLVGSRDILELGVAKVMHRDSGIAEKLQRGLRA